MMEFRLREVLPAKLPAGFDLSKIKQGLKLLTVIQIDAVTDGGVSGAYAGYVLEWRNTITGPTHWQEVPIEGLRA